MWSNIFDIKLGEADYTVHSSLGKRIQILTKKNIFSFLIKLRTYVKYHV